jgi:hypothetical protein
MPEATPPSRLRCQHSIERARMPTVTRIKTAKVPFALATPKGPLVETDGRVPPPAVAEIALRLSAPLKMRGPFASTWLKGPKGQNCRNDGDETDA